MRRVQNILKVTIDLDNVKIIEEEETIIIKWMDKLADKMEDNMINLRIPWTDL